MASSYDGTCPRDLLEGLVAETTGPRVCRPLYRWMCTALSWKSTAVLLERKEKRSHYLNQIYRLNRVVLWVSAMPSSCGIMEGSSSTHQAIESRRKLLVSYSTPALKTDFVSFIWNIMHVEWFRRLFLITLEISVRQDKTMLYDEEPSKGRRNKKIGEIRQVHEAINILPRRYHKISSGRRDIFFKCLYF